MRFGKGTSVADDNSIASKMIAKLKTKIAAGRVWEATGRLKRVDTGEIVNLLATEGLECDELPR